jgi:hypothetical protein
MSDALFGVDGTESPQLWSDSSGRDSWRDAPVLPPLLLPPIPGPDVTQEAVAAALGEDPRWLVDPNPDPPPAQHPGAAPNVGSTHETALLPPQAAPQLGGPSAVVAPDHSRPRVAAPIPPATPSSPRPSGLFFRSPLSVGSRMPARLGDLRRRVGRQGSSLSLQFGSNGGAGAFFFIALIIFVILAYGIIAGIVESVIRLFQ